jgi:predicted nucleic acid-binding protein
LEVILLDTNVLIEILKGNQKTIQEIESLNKTLFISSITVMELYYGALNKAEIKKLEKFIMLFNVLHIDKNISIHSTELIKSYAKSHTLDIPDSLIAATALEKELTLFTYNTKDFKYISHITLL